MKIEIEQVEYGYIYTLKFPGEEEIKKVFRCNKYDDENVNEMEAISQIFREMIQEFSIFNSKHNSHRLNIEVIKQ